MDSFYLLCKITCIRDVLFSFQKVIYSLLFLVTSWLNFSYPYFSIRVGVSLKRDLPNPNPGELYCMFILSKIVGNISKVENCLFFSFTGFIGVLINTL